MQKKILIAVLWGLFLGHLFSVKAQSKLTLENFLGTISAVNAQTAEITIVTAENATFIVNAANKTEIKQIAAGETDIQKAVKIDFNVIEAGDTVLVRGSVSDKKTISAKQIVVIKKTDIATKEMQKREEWKQRGISGAIIKTEPAQRKISVQLRGQTQPTEVFISENIVIQRYKPNAASLNDFAPSQFAEFREGEQVRILSRKNTEATHLDAEEIFVGSFNTRVGKVVSVNAEKSELKITDTLNKTISVVVNPESNIRRITEDLLKNGNLKTSESDGKINLTNLLENAPKVAVADIRIGETIAVANAFDSQAERIVGLIVVTGIDSLKNQSAKKSVAPVRTFNLDVF